MVSNNNNKKVIAFIIYPGISPLDIVGPMYVLGGAAGYTREYAVVSVGQRREPAVSDTPLQLIPEYTFGEVPDPYGLILPGGGPQTLPAMADPALRDYLLSAAENAGVIGSVGTGSLILAAAGLLQGKQAATHWAYAKVLENLGARFISRRWVEDGRFITAAGNTAGIDMAIHLAARLMGETNARRAQLFGEYDPHPPLGPIDWQNVDREHPPAHLLPDPGALKRAFSNRPDLLAAVAHWTEKEFPV
jgi:transcriptional regulator GlxA family with amidase domain